MYRRLFVTGVVLLSGGCSATVHYQAVSYYTESPDGAVAHFDNEEACSSGGGNSCTKVMLSWETERYCGIYRGADDAVSEQVMRVGKSPFALTNWQLVEDQSMLLGDDEFFVGLDDEAATLGADILCGQFAPPASLVEVHDGDILNLMIYCRAAEQGITIMPASATGYPLNVAATAWEKSWLGCRR